MASGMFTARNGFKMVWIYASWVLAAMMKIMALGNRTYKGFIDRPMGQSPTTPPVA